MIKGGALNQPGSEAEQQPRDILDSGFWLLNSAFSSVHFLFAKTPSHERADKNQAFEEEQRKNHIN